MVLFTCDNRLFNNLGDALLLALTNYDWVAKGWEDITNNIYEVSDFRAVYATFFGGAVNEKLIISFRLERDSDGFISCTKTASLWGEVELRQHLED